MENVRISMSLSQNAKKTFYTRKKMLIFITLVFVILTIYQYIINVRIMHFDPPDNNIKCHYVYKDDVLPSAEAWDFFVRPNSIYFLETSCRGGVDSRQACSIESASRAHPRRLVYVMFSGPVSDVVYRRSCIAILRRLPNVRFARIHIVDFARNTPLEDLIAGDPFNKSKWRVEHTADVLRLLILYKWGGTYLDTDMMVIKSLTPLGHNWVAKEDNMYASNGAIAISRDDIGRNFMDVLIDEVRKTFRPDIWTYNGPDAITRVLAKTCNTPNITEWSCITCQGMEVYNQKYFYPLHYSENHKYFKTEKLEDVDDAYTHHFWNRITHKKKIEKDSQYAKMAQEFCPKIYEMYGEEFGS